ncbi:anaerobic ribonucleoside-triphosphate reductase activating protein [Paenibacillus odorifer]|uniref:anaerobic ribonucleoside-triphosphate reductase activating protein n=1 Tax=Paenibacillus odorifer TaxID=189426 RepID=UPI00096F2613|nr:anaerobic ribonucleoside-triphosphate reductase activating protein [Paenibacillus odorifer]OME55575.1 anaerobic ribonucleoside-triphosphate reductase activating protein [Paenibacillus odorifer]
MNIADYKRFDVINGQGIRHSLYTSGCTHKCRGCFNASIWNFGYGELFTDEFEERIIDDLKIDYVKVQGLSILGGEPLQNVEGLLPLLKRIKKECKSKDIWIWSGYTFEEIIKNEKMNELISYCDVLIDGRFELERRDLTLKWRGSSNQRILDVKESLKEGKVILLSLDE